MSKQQPVWDDGEPVTLPLRSEDNAQQAENDPLPLKLILVGLAIAAMLLFAAVVVLQVFVAEDIPDLTADALEDARERWQERGPSSYDLNLEIGGAQPGTVHLEVRDQLVTVANRDGRPTPQRTWDEWSVPGQFETLERELEMADDPQREMQAPAGTQLRLRCDFDPELGYPRRYHRYATGGAPEVYWRTTSFNPL